MAADDLRVIERQERELVFDAFDENRAFALGSTARELALADSAGVVVDVRLWNRPLFFAAMPGSHGNNPEWARRKINTVSRYFTSTYRLVVELKRAEQFFGPEANLPPTEYVLAGGGFPITVKGAGAIGAIAVSGLPQREDHVLVVRMLCAHLGLDAAKYALPHE